MTKLDASGAALGYSSYLGGSEGDEGHGIALDGAGNAYLTGSTGSSADFPTTAGAFDTTHNGAADAFVTKLDASGAALGYSSYLGGSGYDQGLGIALDGAGSAYLIGTTVSANFPTTAGAFDTTYNGDFDAFVTKLDLVAGPPPPPPPPHLHHHLHHRLRLRLRLRLRSASASAAAAASATAATAASAATAATARCPVRGAEGDRLEASPGPHADPRETLLGRSHPPCSLQASGPRDRPEPEAGEEARTRQQGEPRRRPQITNGATGQEVRPGWQQEWQRDLPR